MELDLPVCNFNVYIVITAGAILSVYYSRAVHEKVVLLLMKSFSLPSFLHALEFFGKFVTISHRITIAMLVEE